MASTTEQTSEALVSSDALPTPNISENVMDSPARPHSPIIYTITKQPVQKTITKRKQVKVACTNCQHACKKCDERRPCQRCVAYEVPHSCVDSVRKVRQKGIKRGASQSKSSKKSKRKAKADRQDQPQPQVIPHALIPIPQVAYPQYYGQYPMVPPVSPRPREPIYYPSVAPFYLGPVPQGGEQSVTTGYVVSPLIPIPTPYGHPLYSIPPPVLSSPDGQAQMAQGMPVFPQYAQPYPLSYTRPIDPIVVGSSSNIQNPTKNPREVTALAAADAA